MDIETVREFLGWCTVINVGFLILTGLVWVLVNENVSLPAGMLGLTQEEFRASFFDGLILYRVLIFALNLAPYLALKIMASRA